MIGIPSSLDSVAIKTGPEPYRDPNANMVEFCHTTRPFTAEEKATALATLNDPHPHLDNDAKATIHEAVTVGANA